MWVCSGNKCTVTMSSCSGPELLECMVEAPAQTVLFICAACVYLIINIHLCECFTDFYMLILKQPSSLCRQRKHLFLLFSNPIEMNLGVSHKWKEYTKYWMKVFCAISLTKYSIKDTIIRAAWAVRWTKELLFHFSSVCFLAPLVRCLWNHIQIRHNRAFLWTHATFFICDMLDVSESRS